MPRKVRPGRCGVCGCAVRRWEFVEPGDRANGEPHIRFWLNGHCYAWAGSTPVWVLEKVRCDSHADDSQDPRIAWTELRCS